MTVSKQRLEAWKNKEGPVVPKHYCKMKRSLVCFRETLLPVRADVHVWDRVLLTRKQASQLLQYQEG